MDIRFSKRFIKQLSKLPPKQEAKFYERLELWKINPNDPRLNHHALSGKLKGFYSLNITGDLRALYKVYDGIVYVYELIGTHAQLYGQD